MIASVSVVIPTKNRSNILKLCLNSLTKQTIQPTEVIIIDNNSTDNTQEVISYYSKKLSIVSKITKTSNYPLLYNTAIKIAKSDIIACLDDDCKANKFWIKNIIKSHRLFKNSVIQGNVRSIPLNNIYSSIMGLHYKNWLISHLNDDNTLNVIDTKNVSFPKKIIKKNLFLNDLKLGSHDIEIGKRLVKKKIPILYEKNIRVTHRERTTFNGMVKQHWRIAKSEAVANKYLEKNDKVSILVNKKNMLTLNWLTKKILNEIKNLKIISVLKLIAIYSSLFFIRIIGFNFTLARLKIGKIYKKKWWIPLVFTVASIIASLLIAFFIAENYFFDQFFLNKSIEHGYWVQGKNLSLEDFGERSKDLIDLKKGSMVLPEDTFTIALIGDSHVWGQGLKFKNTLAHILEKELNKTKKTKVLALGEQGDSILDYLLKFNQISKNYEADLYIFALVDNDLLIKQENKQLYSSLSAYEICKNRHPKLTEVFDFSQETFESISKDPNYHTAEEINNEHIENFKKSWESPINLCFLNEAVNQLPTQNSIFLISQYYADSDENWKNYIDALDNNNKFTLDMSQSKNISKYKEYWSEPIKYFQVSEIEGHPSALANEIWSSLLLEQITSDSRWKFID